MTTCTRRFQFCAGHRVWGHEGKCAFLHGHNYVAFFEACAPQLDSLGRVIDFGVLKSLLGAWIDENWDHAFIISRDDVEALEALNRVKAQRLYLMDANPTAENMSQHLLLDVAPKVLSGSSVKVTKVTLWETENCFAEAAL